MEHFFYLSMCLLFAGDGVISSCSVARLDAFFFFYRGMQWKGGRLIPCFVDKLSIRKKKGTKKAVFFPDSALLESCHFRSFFCFKALSKNFLLQAHQRLFCDFTSLFLFQTKRSTKSVNPAGKGFILFFILSTS